MQIERLEIRAADHEIDTTPEGNGRFTLKIGPVVIYGVPIALMASLFDHMFEKPKEKKKCIK